MYKYIGLIVWGAMAVPAFAVTEWTTQNCNNKGGEIVQSSTGEIYCKSISTMNWWSAYAWCEAMGGHMPSMEEMCPGANLLRGAPCPSMNGTADHWSKTPNGDSNVYFPARGVVIQDGGKSGSKYVWCLPN